MGASPRGVRPGLRGLARGLEPSEPPAEPPPPPAGRSDSGGGGEAPRRGEAGASTGAAAAAAMEGAALNAEDAGTDQVMVRGDGIAAIGAVADVEAVGAAAAPWTSHTLPPACACWREAAPGDGGGEPAGRAGGGGLGRR